MKRISRRQFIKVLVGLFAFIPTIKVLADLNDEEQLDLKLTDEPPLPHPPPDAVSVAIENYSSGNAIELSAEKILIQTFEGDVMLHISPKTEVWEGLWVKEIPIEIGSHIIAWGERQGDGSLLVEKMWVDIVNLLGSILDITEDQDSLQIVIDEKRSGSEIKVVVNERFATSEDGQHKVQFGSEPIVIYKGQIVQVIGRRFEDGTVLATNFLTAP